MGCRHVDSQRACAVNHGAELPKILMMMFKHFKDPKVQVPSAVRKITLNTDESSYFGEKYKIEKVTTDFFIECTFDLLDSGFRGQWPDRVGCYECSI